MRLQRVVFAANSRMDLIFALILQSFLSTENGFIGVCIKIPILLDHDEVQVVKCIARGVQVLLHKGSR